MERHLSPGKGLFVLEEPTEVPVKVAVVDDHELVREGIVALFARDFPLNVEVTYSGGDTRFALASGPEVVLLDVDLGPQAPHVTKNVDLCVSRGVHVLLISANEDARSIRSALSRGALGFVPKRVGTNVLAEALEAVGQGELYLSMDLAGLLAAAHDSPELSQRELDALRLYASGLTLNAVAHTMNISPHTAKEYLDRVRRKYADLGRLARTRTELFVAATHDGLLGGSR